MQNRSNLNDSIITKWISGSYVNLKVTNGNDSSNQYV